MPFLAPLVPAIIGGAASAGAGAIASKLVGGGTDPNKPSQQALGNVQQGVSQDQAFVNALQGVNGIGNQQNVFNELQNIVAGQGPNPAQAMLNQATAQNVANQAALMGSQRGVSANPGLIARQAAQQGGNLQQQAIGQGATLQAQQSLGALSGLGDIAQQQIANQQAGLNAYNNAAYNQLAGAQGPLAQQNNAAQNNIVGGVLGGVGNAVGGALGQVFPNQQPPVRKADGGMIGSRAAGDASASIEGPRSHAMRYMSEGGEIDGEMYAKSGMKVPGHAKIAGDSLKNDVVPAMLSPGEIIIPRSHASDPEKAAKFAAAVAARHRKYALGGIVKK